MSNPLKMAVRALWRAQKRAGGVAVSYRTDTTTAQSLTMVPGITETDNQYDDGTVESEKLADFIVPHSELGVLPQLGHRIVWDNREYEVLSPGTSRHYEWADQYETLLRIHTKQVTASEASLADWVTQGGDQFVTQQGDNFQVKATL